MKWYYDGENGKYISENELLTAYKQFGISDGYQSFSDYKTACMAQNNGILHSIEERINKLVYDLRNIHTNCPDAEEEAEIEAEIDYCKSLQK